MRRRLKRMKRIAARAPNYIVDIAASKNPLPRLNRRKSLGRFGAASPVRQIDPKTGQPIEA